MITVTPDRPTVAIWERDGAGWAMVGQVRTHSTLNIEPRHLQAGPWSLVMPLDSQARSITKKRLVTVDFRGTRFTGAVEVLAPQSDEKGQPVLEASGTDALSLLGDAACYPDPDSGPTAQLKTHYQASGDAETVLTDLIRANWVTRRGEQLVIPPSAGRGSKVHLNLFFNNLLEVVLKKAQRGGLGIRMGLVNTTSATRAVMALEFYEPRDRSSRVRLSHKVGTLRTWKQSDTVPAGTRAIVAGAIEGTPYRIADVNLPANKLTTDGAHGLRTGDQISFHGSALPSPLDDGEVYFAIRLDADTFKVAGRRSHALDGTAMNLTDLGGLKVDSVVSANDNLTVSKGDVPDTGSRFKVIGDGVAPDPLEKGTTYYAIKVDRDTIKAASSPGNADAGTQIHLTNNGSGELRIFEVGARKVVKVARRIVATADTAAEDEWGRSREIFVDARGDDSDDDDVFREKGDEALADVASQSSFELEAADAEGMRYGQHFIVGDLVTVELLTGVSAVEQLTAVQIAQESGGITVKLVPGNPDAGNPMFAQAAIIRGALRRLRNLEQEES